MIIVTGGAGFIGSNIVKELNRRGRTDILIVDDLKDGQNYKNLRGLQFIDYQHKDDFLQSIEKYKQKKLPFSAPLSILQSWIARFDEEYLKEQTFFEPFPEKLIELCRDTQCEWAGADLFEGRKAGRAD